MIATARAMPITAPATTPGLTPHSAIVEGWGGLPEGDRPGARVAEECEFWWEVKGLEVECLEVVGIRTGGEAVPDAERPVMIETEEVVLPGDEKWEGLATERIVSRDEEPGRLVAEGVVSGDEECGVLVGEGGVLGPGDGERGVLVTVGVGVLVTEEIVGVEVEEVVVPIPTIIIAPSRGVEDEGVIITGVEDEGGKTSRPCDCENSAIA